MDLQHYKTLGKSGLKVSPLCLGTMTFGEEWNFGSSVSESESILNHYLDLGGNFIDTANFYTRGHAEAIIGNFLAQDKSKRQQVVVATKFFAGMYTGNPNAGGTGRKNIMWACEESLRRLQTDYIDLYWMHCWDYFTPIEETMRALDDLVSAGKVRYIGFSDTPAWKVAQAQVMASFRGWAPLVGLQVEYSLLERTVEGELIPMARELGLGVTPWAPLKSGLLSGKYRRQDRDSYTPTRGDWVKSLLTDKNFDVIEELVKVASEVGATPAQVALKWLMLQPGVSSPIMGARTLSQLEDNLAAFKVQLSDEHQQMLGKVSRPQLNFPADFISHSPSFRNSGTIINGEKAELNQLAPGADKSSY